MPDAFADPLPNEMNKEIPKFIPHSHKKASIFTS